MVAVGSMGLKQWSSRRPQLVECVLDPKENQCEALDCAGYRVLGVGASGSLGFWSDGIDLNLFGEVLSPSFTLKKMWEICLFKARGR